MSGNVDLTTDYTFDETNDKYLQVEINGTAGKKITINGNNKTIDANGKAGGFIIKDADVTINDLTFKNAAKSAIILQNSTLFLNNVDFADNKDNESGAAIFCNFGAVTVNNALFSNNYAPKVLQYMLQGENWILSVLLL